MVPRNVFKRVGECSIRITDTPKTLERKVRSDKTGITRQLKQRSKKFVAWDGEGYNRNGHHVYGLFGNSLSQRVYNPTWQQCFRLLFEAPADAIHVIYAGTYDVVMMLRNLPQITPLLKGMTVHLEQYRVTFLRGKMLRITDRERKETRTLYDVFSFFQTSFVKACREYLGNLPIIDEIESMKMQRNTFTEDQMTDSVAGYMNQELAMLVELCEELRSMLAKVNIHPSQWHGPGAVASTVLRSQGIKEHKRNDDNGEFRRKAEGAYYGGRFEPFKRGRANQRVYQYDIRSAYPDAMRYLPSLRFAEWFHTTDNSLTVSSGFNPFGLYRVEYLPRSRSYREIGYLPHRNPKGNIYFPDWVNGWYWGVEIPQWMSEFVTEAYVPYGISMTDSPFQFVEEMYEQRAKLKRAKQPHQLALKLALNSLYGKLAQSKGAKIKDGEWQYPTYHEIVWAGWITAYTRRKISDALHSVPYDAIIATETDSVFSLEPLPVDVGSGLGQWELTELDDIIYLQSGVSLQCTDGEWKFKTRGFTLKRHESLLEIWESYLSEKVVPPLTVEQTRFGTDPRQKTFGEWYTSSHSLTLDSNPLEKRVHVPCEHCANEERYAHCLHPLIVPPIPYQPTKPYQFVWNPEYVPSETPWVSMVNDDPVLEMEMA